MGLARHRPLIVEPVGLTAEALPPLPDDLSSPEALAQARVDPRSWFERPEQPLELEIGPGKGAFLVSEAAARPDVNFLGIEQAGEVWAYAADRCRRRGLTNVRLLHADATAFLRWRAPDEVFRVIHLYFSDPWPKKRHHKRRVVQDGFLADAWRTLAPGGELRVVTDHDDYWAWMEERFARWCDPARPGPRFERLPFDEAARPASAKEGELVGTNYERKFVPAGAQPHAAALRKA